MAKVLTAEARITATSSGFEAIANKVRGVASAFKSLSGATASVGHNMNHNVGRLQKAIGTLAPVAAGAAAYKGMHGVSSVVHETIKATAEQAHEGVRMTASGMMKGEIEEAQKLAGEMSGKYKSVSQTQIMHSLRNMRSVVGTFEEATKILDPLLKLRVVAQGAHPEHAAELNEDFDKLIKGMEIKGVTQNLPKFTHYMDGMAKAINVFGDTLRPTDYYEMFKYGRASTNALSDHFMLNTASTLAQELGGSSTGKALSSFYTQFVGGKMSNTALAQLQKYDLVDPKKVVKTKTGNVKGVLPGGIKGTDAFGHDYLKPGQTDPFEWVNKVLIPAMAKKGVTDPARIQEVIAAMSSQTTTAQMLGIFATQVARILKDQRLVAGAQGLEAANTFQKNDPYIAMSGVTEQWNNLLSAAGSPLVPAAAAGLNMLSDALVRLTKAAKEHPADAAAYLVGGGAAAVAGTAAAGWGALKLAGKALGGRAAVTAAAPVAEATATRAAAFAAAEAVFGGTAGTAAGVGLFPWLVGGALAASPLVLHDATKEYAGMTLGDRLRMQRGGSMADAYRRRFGLPELDREAFNRRMIGWGAAPGAGGMGGVMDSARSFVAGTRAPSQPYRNPEDSLRRWGALPGGLAGGAAAGAGGMLDTARSFMGEGGIKATVQGPIMAQLEGKADVSVTVEVKPSESFWTQVRSIVSNVFGNIKVNGGTAPTGTGGSTGKTMPEAGAGGTD